MADRRYCPCKACSSCKPPQVQIRQTIYNHLKKEEQRKRESELKRQQEQNRKSEEKRKAERKKASAKAQLASLSMPSAQGPSLLTQPLSLKEKSGNDPGKLTQEMAAEEEQLRRVERRAAYSHILKVCQDAIDQLDSASPETEADKVRTRPLSPEPNFGVKRRREDVVGRDEQVRLPLHRERRSSPAEDDLRHSPYIYRSLRILSFSDGLDRARPSLAERSRARRQERDERRCREQAEDEARKAGPSASHIESREPSDELGQDEGVFITDMLCTKCAEAALSEEELKELKESGMQW
ncbi:hypothetical protein EWM64_g10696 [Hericium alpestre]|uniref:Uncharacterized protein n=1 Tax=Hericium alpestre TaxID=135208 RepID=A0A4Y9ZEV4_9AGAM|nr:hypothetical protein EWM64_g10696 [Hericium alpestre]